jgi:hypothetical protein
MILERFDKNKERLKIQKIKFIQNCRSEKCDVTVRKFNPDIDPIIIINLNTKFHLSIHKNSSRYSKIRVNPMDQVKLATLYTEVL